MKFCSSSIILSSLPFSFYFQVILCISQTSNCHNLPSSKWRHLLYTLNLPVPGRGFVARPARPLSIPCPPLTLTLPHHSFHIMWSTDSSRRFFNPFVLKLPLLLCSWMTCVKSDTRNWPTSYFQRHNTKPALSRTLWQVSFLIKSIRATGLWARQEQSYDSHPFDWGYVLL